LYCGGSDSIKGWDILIEAWPIVVEKIAGARLEALGFSSRYELRSGNGIVDSIELRGWLSERETCEAMERAAVLVIPSRYEVAPLILAEAWASGLPIVVASVGGIPTLAAGAALLVPDADPPALAARIVDALRGGEAVAHLVQEGLSRAQAYRIDGVVDAHVNLYSNLSRL
jgi:2-deoxystreptamine N-acetyl-D-glucosaminyltransferase/2-deoxystreptamine glucosyltransferase